MAQLAEQLTRNEQVVRSNRIESSSTTFPFSSTAEHSAVNRRVAGSSPARGAITLGEVFHEPSVKPARPLSEVSHELSGAGGTET